VDKPQQLCWRLAPLGDAALLAEAAGDDHEAANRAALAAAAALEADPPPGFVAAVPGIASLLVCFEPLATHHARLERLLLRLLATAGAAGATGRVVAIDVRFGGDDGPDLDEAARALGLAPSEAVALLTAAPLRVQMIGFAPGYPYLGPLPAALRLPRRPTPRPAVPAGSVAIAAGLAGIYPARLPGGWHLVGRTAARLFDPAADPPALLAPGDMVQLVAAEAPR
jgi:KipI family sensor histidine kinase inhibitor